MNLDKAKILLDKINVLMRSMAVSPEHVAEIEKDLMKNYIRQLYESVLEEDGVIVKTPAKPLPTKRAPAPKPKPIVVEPVIEPEIAPVEAAPPVVIPQPKSVPPPPAPKPKPAPKMEMEVVAPPPPPPKPKSKPKPVATGNMDPDLEEIFNLPNATDLSEKLSQSTIKDLTKAFSINDKILTIKELFGGDDSLFNDSLKAINKMSSFDEAQSYLIANVANKHNWAKTSRKKKAKVFAKMIKRRFN